MAEYLKQADQPLFADILWSRPVLRTGAGRLLLIGGHPGHFSQIQAVYQSALAAGIGECRVVVPDSLRVLLADAPDSVFVPATNSGSLGKPALAQILDEAAEADAVAIGADLGNNSETSLLLESLATKFEGRLVVYAEAFESLKHNLGLLANRPQTLILGLMPELFRLGNALKLPLKIEPERELINKIEIIQKLSQAGRADYLLLNRDMITVAQSQTSVTSAVSSMDFLVPAMVGVAATFWLQNQNKRFEGLTTAAYILRQVRQTLADNDADKALLVGETVAAIRKAIQSEA